MPDKNASEKEKLPTQRESICSLLLSLPKEECETIFLEVQTKRQEIEQDEKEKLDHEKKRKKELNIAIKWIFLFFTFLITTLFFIIRFSSSS